MIDPPFYLPPPAPLSLLFLHPPRYLPQLPLFHPLTLTPYPYHLSHLELLFRSVQFSSVSFLFFFFFFSGGERCDLI